MDKRIVKTTGSVSDALLDLLTTKDLKKISVVELCQKAGINKSTFYLHYSSLDDCCKKTFYRFAERFFDISENIDYTDMAYSPEKTIDVILDAVEANVDYIKKFKDCVLYDSAVSSLKKKIIDSICKANNLTLQNNSHQVAKVTFVVAGCFDVFDTLLPNYNHDEIRDLMVSVIKRK